MPLLLGGGVDPNLVGYPLKFSYFIPKNRYVWKEIHVKKPWFLVLFLWIRRNLRVFLMGVEIGFLGFARPPWGVPAGGWLPGILNLHLLLMVQKSGLHQLRLVVYPSICKVFLHPRWWSLPCKSWDTLPTSTDDRWISEPSTVVLSGWTDMVISKHVFCGKDLVHHPNWSNHL